MVRLTKRPAEPRRRADQVSGLGRRFENSLLGEALISALVSMVILIGVIWNLPDSQIKRALTPTLQPIAASTGLQQKWSMYAPDPVSGLESIQVRVTMADGPERTWTWHPGDRVIGPFIWYRWQKLKEQTVRDPDSRAGLARWAVREVTSPAERPVRVRMVFRNELLPPPGKDGPKTVTVTTLSDEPLSGRP